MKVMGKILVPDGLTFSQGDGMLALEMIRDGPIDAANIDSNGGNKSKLYYQFGIGLYRIGDGKGTKKALKDCLKEPFRECGVVHADEPKNIISKSTLLKHVPVAGGLALGLTYGCLSKLKLLKHVAVAGGLAVGVACTMIFSWEKLDEIREFSGGLKKAGEVGESIEKMTVTCKDSYPTGTASVVVGIVGAAFLIGLKKSSSG
ncbi:hypothetical protein Tco_0747455 [Tanacetum coccineum]|uniref:Uncharacterized protein n=1 Tax=Tanacetum coccineum TaxID=301880 RepID=A0ABQ4YSR9_9ASTR